MAPPQAVSCRLWPSNAVASLIPFRATEVQLSQGTLPQYQRGSMVDRGPATSLIPFYRLQSRSTQSHSHNFDDGGVGQEQGGLIRGPIEPM